MRFAGDYGGLVVSLLKLLIAAMFGFLAGLDLDRYASGVVVGEANSRTIQHLTVVGLSGPEVTITPHPERGQARPIVIPSPGGEARQVWTELAVRDSWKGSLVEAGELTRTFLRARFRTNARPEEGAWLDSQVAGLAIQFFRSEPEAQWVPGEDFRRQNPRLDREPLIFGWNDEAFMRITEWAREGGGGQLRVDAEFLDCLLNPGGRFMLIEHSGPLPAGKLGGSKPMPYSALTRLFAYDWLSGLEGSVLLTLQHRSEGGSCHVAFEFDGEMAFEAAEALRSLLMAQIEPGAELDYSHDLEGSIHMEGAFAFSEGERRLIFGGLTAKFSCAEKGHVRIDSSGGHLDYGFLMRWDGTVYCDTAEVVELKDW